MKHIISIVGVCLLLSAYSIAFDISDVKNKLSSHQALTYIGLKNESKEIFSNREEKFYIKSSKRANSQVKTLLSHYEPYY